MFPSQSTLLLALEFATFITGAAGEWTSESQGRWVSTQCSLLQGYANGKGVAFYPDIDAAYDANRSSGVSPAPPLKTNRIAMVYPWVNWGVGIPSETVIPAYFRYWIASAAMNVDLVDFLIFTSDILKPLLEEATRSVPNVIIHAVEDFRTLYSRALDFPELIIDGHTLKDLKPMHGLVYKDYLESYSHWGYGDLDLIYGA